MAEALALNAAAMFAAALALWLLSLVMHKVSYADAVWGLAMAGLAVLSWWQAEPQGPSAHLIAAMTIVWGLRLGLHLLRRFLRHGEDKRYAAMLAPAREAGRFAMTALWKVWLLQAALILLVSSPSQVGILASDAVQTPGSLAWIGIAIYFLGLLFEWVGDWQLDRFKADPFNRGKVMDCGLWRYTRHPNYFGDACVWWGIWLVAVTIAPEAVIWTLPGPLFLTFTLVRWSGAGMTEEGMRERYGAAFADYVRRTPAFVPWVPRKS
ncbi:MAG: DUF1295 domain-containing protein [Erythrobacter sp.]|nr:MAG: DUF1295 domain-containing protein [Erythrobacter sp.]